MIDLTGEGNTALRKLVLSGYGNTQKEAVERAIFEASARLQQNG